MFDIGDIPPQKSKASRTMRANLMALIRCHLMGDLVTITRMLHDEDAIPWKNVIAVLTVLHLWNNRISDAGAASLAAALPTSKLTVLKLTLNQISAVWKAQLRQAAKECEVI